MAHQPAAPGQTPVWDGQLSTLAREVRASPFPADPPRQPPDAGQEKPDALQGLISSCSFKRIFSLEGTALLIAAMTDISTNRARNPALTPWGEGGGMDRLGAHHAWVAPSILCCSGYHQPCREQSQLRGQRRGHPLNREGGKNPKTPSTKLPAALRGWWGCGSSQEVSAGWKTCPGDGAGLPRACDPPAEPRASLAPVWTARRTR